jgi:tRNA(adenine34) deaminase
MEDRWIKECLRQAKRAFDVGEVPVGAVVVKDGKVIAKAHNRVESLRDPTAHAELLAIKKALKKAEPKISSWLHFVCFFGALCHVCLRIGFSPYR